LVLRAVSVSSRRQMAVQLTAEGKRLLKKAEAPVHEAYEQLMAPLDEAQRQQLVSLLQTLTDNLGEQARAAFVPLQHG
jgi:DNA-binding MarR family transcriptional regulator